MFFAYILLLSCLTCKQRTNSININLHVISKDTVINVNSSKKYPTTLKIHVKGLIDDTCILSGVKLKPKQVDTFWHQDWYSKKIILNYQSYRAKEGGLSIECHVY